ncbi:MAG TPA: hypothetical protein VEL07_14735 [Planctomycetota bacterium]|nr:hypothetical protein [Planctomycetota bacterium]
MYTLIASLRSQGMDDAICVLGVGLDAPQQRLLEQFPDVVVAPGLAANLRNPAARKGEALLATAERFPDATYITLLDGDCVATGDFASAFRPSGTGFFGRMKSPDEDAMVFRTRYAAGEATGSVPRSILATWRTDVGERDQPRITNTFTGGNLIVHRDALPFVRRWQEQIDRILPAADRGSHDQTSHAYSQVDESVLNSLLAFAHDVPAIGRHALDADPRAYLAHLGPGKPRPWVCWRWDRVRYYRPVRSALRWARRGGYALPALPWSYRGWTLPAVYAVAAAEGLARWAWMSWKRLRGR